MLSGCDTTTILDHDVARAAVSARCGGALGPDEASGWQRGHSVDLVPGRHGSPHTKLGNSALLSAIALPPAGLQRVSYMVNALAVDDVAGALQADAGDGDGSAPTSAAAGLRWLRAVLGPRLRRMACVCVLELPWWPYLQGR